jgi:hypothetical protein
LLPVMTFGIGRELAGSQPTHYPNGERDGEQESAEVGKGLGQLYPMNAQQPREHQDGWDEEKPLSAY